MVSAAVSAFYHKEQPEKETQRIQRDNTLAPYLISLRSLRKTPVFLCGKKKLSIENSLRKKRRVHRDNHAIKAPHWFADERNATQR
jgi:hypothetical protein